MTADVDVRAPRLASPYRGLMPYTEADAELFFGRENDIALIANNVRSSRFGVLYGPSGVGKSSVLRAGVVRRIRDENQMRFDRFGRAETVVAYAKDWRDDPVQALRTAIRQAFETMPGAVPLEAVGGTDLVEEVLAWRRARSVDVLLILDQFEEFFLYHRERVEETAELLARLTERGNRVNVCVSIREDALALLDEFEADVAGVFENTLRLEHLDLASAESAIRKPLDHYNRGVPEVERMGLEDGLVTELLNQVRIGRVRVDSSHVDHVDLGDDDERDTQVARIEAPYLQLVLMRLWEEETRTGSGVLRLATLEHLGGAQEIVRQHLNRVMAQFAPPELEVLADAFGYLVTPSGSKIAHRASDLAYSTNREVDTMQALLRRLTDGEHLILREIPPPMEDPDPSPRYEIYHDVLALAVLDWRRRYLQDVETRRSEAELVAEKERVEGETRAANRRLRRARAVVGLMALLLLACAALAAGALVSRQNANHARHAARTSETAARDANLKVQLGAVLDEVNLELHSDPSQALVDAQKLVFDPQHDKDGLLQDAFRRAFDAADTDVVLDLGSPVTLASFVGNSGVVAVTKAGRVLVWDVVSHDPVRVDPRPRVDIQLSGNVVTPTMSASGHFVVVQTGADTTAVDLRSGAEEAFKGPFVVGGVEAPVDGSGDDLLVHDYRGHAVIWDVATNEQTSLARLGHQTGAAAIDPTGEYFAEVVWSGSSRVVVGSTATGQQVASTPLVSHVSGHTDDFVDNATLAFTATGSPHDSDDPLLVITATTRETEAAAWDVLHDDGDGPTPLGDPFQWHQVFASAGLKLEAAADGSSETRIAVAGDKTVSLFDHFGTLLTQTPAGGDWRSNVVADPAYPSAFALSANEGYVQLYRTNVDPPAPMWTFHGHRGPVSDLAFSKDGKSLVSAGADGTVRVWRLPPQLDSDWYIPDWILAARFTPDGHYVFGYSPHYGYVTREDVDTKKIISKAAGTLGMVQDMSPSPAGQRAAVVDVACGPPLEVGLLSSGDAVTLSDPQNRCATQVAWNPADGVSQIVAGDSEGDIYSFDADTGQLTGSVKLGDGNAVADVAISGDGKTVVVATDSGSTGTIWTLRAADLSEVKHWPTPAVSTIDTSRDGRWVAEGELDHHVVFVFDAHAQHPDQHPLALNQASGTLGLVTLSPDADATRVAVPTSEGDVYVWSRESGQLLAVMHRHSDAADAVAFDPNDLDHMFSAGDDGFMVQYTCSLCSTSASQLKALAQDRLPQTVDMTG